MTTTTTLPTRAEWRVLVWLLNHGGSDLPRGPRADLILNATMADPGDLGTLAEDGLIEGVDNVDHDIDLAENWNTGLRYVWLRLTSKGRTWLRNSEHTAMLFDAQLAGGKLRLTPRRVRERDEVLLDLLDRALIELHDEDGTDIQPRPAGAPSNQCPGRPLFLRLTRYGAAIAQQ